MAKQNFEKQMASFLVRFRAICEDDTYKGRWRSNEEEAKKDARKHRQKPGNELHILNIFTEQTIGVKFEE